MSKICSMTGFASIDHELDGIRLMWEIRSVNHRYLDISIRLPDAWRALEPEVRQLASRVFRRGKIDCSLRISELDDADAEICIDEQKLQQLVKAVRSVSDKLWDATPLSTLDMLKWPGVVQQRELSAATLRPALLKLLQQGVDSLYESRLREGDALCEALLSRVTVLQQLIEQAEASLPEVLKQFRLRLQARLQELAAEIDEQRLAQEMALLAQKLDVSEEIDRLRTHLFEIERLLQQGGVLGRRLDFLMQELNREANTIASKSADAGLTQLAVEMKVSIEQMREQVQNIE
ncbi:MAG: YicC family protein [gamma proteobacterium symbiont of Bathyaustriella thionipta]|nr:YicC family protein [gamma proteobacterium symbiont of Bathyaustriella thionipta]